MFSVVNIDYSSAFDSPVQVAPWSLGLTRRERIVIRGGGEACLEPIKLDKAHHRSSKMESGARHKYGER